MPIAGRSAVAAPSRAPGALAATVAAPTTAAMRTGAADDRAPRLVWGFFWWTAR